MGREMPVEQAHFRNGLETRDQMNNPRWLMEKLNWKIPCTCAALIIRIFQLCESEPVMEYIEN